jgi:hypothetical protein
MGSLGLPWSVHHRSPAAPDATGVVFPTRGLCAPTAGRIARHPGPRCIVWVMRPLGL